jgi:hypothetical protein
MSTAHQDFDGGVVELLFCLKLARLAEHQRRIESDWERGKPQRCGFGSRARERHNISRRSNNPQALRLITHAKVV